MAKSLVDFIWEQESYDDGLVELPISKTYKGEDGEAVPVVLKLRRPGSVELMSYTSVMDDQTAGAVMEATAAMAAQLLEDPNLSDPRVLSKFSAQTPLQALSRWLELEDLTALITCVANLIVEGKDALAKEQDDAKNS